MRNVSRYFVTSSKLAETIKEVQNQCGPLTKYNVLVSRLGGGKQTTYSVLPKLPATPMTAEMLRAESLKDKLVKFYSPIDEEAQNALVSSLLSHGAGGEAEAEEGADRPY